MFLSRGENGPGCWAMRPVAGDPHQCIFEWLLDTDLKVGNGVFGYFATV